MAVVTFTATSALAAGYISGVEYSIYFECSAYDMEIKPITEDSVSLSGVRETVLHRRERLWDLTTGAMIGLAADQFTCFLASVQDGAEFTFDRFATLDGSGNVVADRPVLCELANDGRRKRLGNRLDAFQFDFKIREVADADVPLYGENFYWDLDLTKGVVPDGWTYTRTGTMYAMDEDGIFKPHAANVMPAHYDAVAGRWLGAWFGITTTNSLLYSSDFANAAWFAANSTKSAASSLIQGGTAQKITNNGASPSRLEQTIGTFGANSDTVFAIAEKGNSDQAWVAVYDNTAGAYVAQATLTFSTGTVVTSGSAANKNGRAHKLQNLGPNGGEVWIIAITFTPPTAGNVRRVMVSSVQSGVTDGTSYGFLHHAQLHANHTQPQSAVVCPPIVTTSASASRGADLMVCQNIPNWWTQREHSIASEFTQKDSSNVIGSGLIALSDGTINNFSEFDFNSSAQVRGRCNTAGAVEASLAMTASVQSAHRVAMRVKAGDFASVSNFNASVVTDLSGALFNSADRYYVGAAYNGSAQPSCYISRALFVPEAWANDELKAWTG